MKIKQLRAAFLAALMSIATFAGAQAVKVNWRIRAPFSDYRSYTWIPNQQDTFYRQFVREDVNKALMAKGLTEAANPNTADLKVVYHFKTEEVMDSATTSDGFGWGGGPWGGWNGWGGWGGWGPWGMGIGFGDGMYTQQQPRTIGILTLDLVDSKSNQVVWRGQATEDNIASSQSGDEEQIQRSIRKLFDQYPPRNAR